MVVVIFAELLRRRLGYVAGLGRSERQIFDAALLVLQLIDGVDPGLGRRHAAGNGVEDLPPDDVLPLLGKEALFGVAHVLQHGAKTHAVELAVDSIQIRVRGDVPRDLCVRQAEPHLSGSLIQRALGDHFAQHLPVEAERIGLIRRNRMTQLRAELPQTVLISLPELVDWVSAPPTVAEVDPPEAAKYVVDTPDREACPRAAVMTTPMTVQPNQFSESLRMPRNVKVQSLLKVSSP